MFLRIRDFCDKFSRLMQRYKASSSKVKRRSPDSISVTSRSLDPIPNNMERLLNASCRELVESLARIKAHDDNHKKNILLALEAKKQDAENRRSFWIMWATIIIAISTIVNLFKSFGG